MKNWTKRYGFIALGILLTACSALISHVLVRENTNEITIHAQQIAIIESQIDQLWQRNLSLKDSEDMLSLLATTSEETPALRAAVLRQLERAERHGGISEEESMRMQQVLVPSARVDALIDTYVITDARKQTLINEIDLLYLEKIERDELISEFNQSNNQLMGLALFFQILGMIFVLIRRGNVGEI